MSEDEVVIGAPDSHIGLSPSESSSDDVLTSVRFDVDGFSGESHTGLLGVRKFADELAQVLESMGGRAELRSAWGPPFSLSIEARPPGRVEVNASVTSQAEGCATSLRFVVEQSYLIETPGNIRRAFRAPSETSAS